MSRSFGTTLTRLARDIDRAHRAQLRHKQAEARAALQSVREAERAQRAYERSRNAELKEQRRLYVESRIAEVDARNEALDEEIRELSSLLINGLKSNSTIDFNSLRKRFVPPKLDLNDLEKEKLPPAQADPIPLSKLWGWIPAVKRSHAERVLSRQHEYELALEKHLHSETARLKAIAERTAIHTAQTTELRRDIDTHNAEIDDFQSKFNAGDPAAIAAYSKLVLIGSELPDNFPRTATTVFLAESKQLIVEYDLPEMDAVVPSVKAYKYVKTSDEVSESPRPESQRRSLYSSVASQTVLRCLHELFASDEHHFIESIVLNAHVDAIDRGTGRRVRPCIISVRTTRDVFDSLDLHQVEASACLRTLNAGVSKNASELAPVRPILELKMVDPRFVKEEDVLSTLDQRPNLMDLKPTEFESLITNLFQAMGLETKMTQASRDGGVDCVAYDPRPIFGGKVIIQAKRYKNTVGVSAVRDLFGTMQNEGASKGILVTTSGYGKAAFDFAANKPMELLSGSNLLFLLEQHAGIEAKIVMPEEWRDPAQDSSS